MHVLVIHLRCHRIDKINIGEIIKQIQRAWLWCCGCNGEVKTGVATVWVLTIFYAIITLLSLYLYYNNSIYNRSSGKWFWLMYWQLAVLLLCAVCLHRNHYEKPQQKATWRCCHCHCCLHMNSDGWTHVSVKDIDLFIWCVLYSTIKGFIIIVGYCTMVKWSREQVEWFPMGIVNVC